MTFNEPTEEPKPIISGKWAIAITIALAVLFLIALGLIDLPNFRDDSPQSSSSDYPDTPILKATTTAEPISALTRTPDPARLLDGYCMRWRNAVGFIWWSEQNGRLSGQIQQVGFYPDFTAEELETQTVPFTGTRQGDWITLDFGWMYTETRTGLLKVDEEGDEYLLLYRPDEDTGTVEALSYHRCTGADYNQFVETLNFTHGLYMRATEWASLSDDAKDATQTQLAVEATETQWAISG